ncbi:DUF4190 domain-containing protein [Streptomyces sp. NPDC050560]|uniref:DUF4190 domain-containing protein n=1 Tax=Streptomyces sp. NPDC050560 TaxID=3365630 RepID=UPI0037B0C1B6
MAQQDIRYPQQNDMPMRRSNGLAIAALVLGILACVLFWTVAGGIVLGLLALVFGVIGARRARGGTAPHRGKAIAGAILGVLGLIVSSVILAAGISIFNSDEFHDYNDCMKHANSQSDKDHCAKEFKNDLNDK